MTREELINKYIYEKSLLEQYGHQSVITFEEWLDIQKIQSSYDKRRTKSKRGEEILPR